MASYHWAICSDNHGSDRVEFVFNPLDITGMFPERSYNAIGVLEGSPLLQFPVVDTSLRTIRFDIAPDEEAAMRDFVLGASETDPSSLLYFMKLNEGSLVTYWLEIPETYKRFRPYGYREKQYIPIRVESVTVTPEAGRGSRPRWRCSLSFRIIPDGEVSTNFQVDVSPLDSLHSLIISKLDKVYTYDASGPTYTDCTNASYEGGSPFPAFTVIAGDMLYCGCESMFYGLSLDMDTPETVEPDEEQGATAHQWQYWNGSAWAAMTVYDGSEGFIKDRCVTWQSLTGWAPDDLSAIASGGPTTSSLYWARCVIGSVTTPWDINKLLRS